MDLYLPNLFDRLPKDGRILVAGCGGGFDVYGGVPVYLALKRLGFEVHLANLTFAVVKVKGASRLTPHLTRVHPGVRPAGHYFPEYHLACWLAENDYPSDVYCFDRTGVQSLRAAYTRLIEELDIDVVITIDGGTDSLMHGNESGLGTPHEDASTLVALGGLDVPSYLVCIGFGVDAFHGVCHAHFLENTAALSREGAFLGTASLLPQMEEAKLYLDLVAFAGKQDPWQPSIVNTSIASAVEGHYGDVHATHRTHGSRLWINPLMSLYWSYELKPVVEKLTYRELIEPTESFQDVVRVLHDVIRDKRGRRPREHIPV